MTPYRVLVACGLVAAAAIGCATASTGSSPQTNQRVLVVDTDTRAITTSTDPSGVDTVIAGMPDRVWDALQAAYAEVGIEVLAINRPIGELGNRNFRVVGKLGGKPASTYFNCGFDPYSGPQANALPIQASLITVIRPESATSTHVESKLTGSARKIGVSANPLYCSSTGELERRIAEATQKHVSQ